MDKNITLENSILKERYTTNDIEEPKLMKELIACLKSARKIDSDPKHVKGEAIEIFIESENKIDNDFVNKYISYLNAKILTNKSENYHSIDIYPGVGVIYTSFENGDKKSIKDLKSAVKKQITFELNRANKMLENKKFVENASKSLVDKEKRKSSFYKASLELIDNGNKI